MKRLIVILALLATATACLAHFIIPFKGWDELIERSPDIFLARRAPIPQTDLQPTNRLAAIVATDRGMSYPIEILHVLKGFAKPGPSELTSPCLLTRMDVLPRQGDLFLAFASGNGSEQSPAGYNAGQDYEIVLVGPDTSYLAWTNKLAGMPLKTQVRTILKYRLIALNEELARGQEEKQRLEDGLKELGK